MWKWLWRGRGRKPPRLEESLSQKEILNILKDYKPGEEFILTYKKPVKELTNVDKYSEEDLDVYNKYLKLTKHSENRVVTGVDVTDTEEYKKYYKDAKEIDLNVEVIDNYIYHNLDTGTYYLQVLLKEKPHNYYTYKDYVVSDDVVSRIINYLENKYCNISESEAPDNIRNINISDIESIDLDVDNKPTPKPNITNLGEFNTIQ
jgi:hypothetical protein